VAMLPLDSKTTNLPSPLTPAANESNVELLIWLMTVSDWAEADTAEMNREIITKRNNRLDFTISSRK
jgi:hypothetical protein